MASPAYALTVSETDVDTTHILEDMIVDSSGNIHSVLIAGVGGGASYNLVYKKYDGSSWSATTIDTGAEGVSYHASIDLDSSNKPGIAWVEWNDTANTQSLFYRKYTGSTWGDDSNTVLVESGMDDTSGKPSLKFYKESDDLNYPTIFTCQGSTYVVEEHKAQGSTNEPTFSAPTSISNNAAHDCSSVDARISTTDTRFVVTSPKGPTNGTAYSHVNTGSGWTAADVFTGVDVQNGSEIFLDDDGTNYHAVMIDDLAGSGTDKILYNVFSSGSWDAFETLTSGAHIGEAYIDVVADTDQDIPYVLYFENASTTAPLKFMYKSSGSWTTGNIDTSGFTLGTQGEDYFNFVAGDYYSGGSKLMVLSTMYLSSGPPFFDLNKYELTDLPTSGGGGVPEFSTYVYIILLTTLFGLLYKKSRIT